MPNDVNLVNEVRVRVLEATRETTRVPSAAELSRALGCSVSDVVGAFAQLGDSHVFVLEPGDPTRLRMANPYSAVPTAFRVETAGRSYYGNCVWDALGIVSLLGGEGTVRTACPDCREPLQLEVMGGRLLTQAGLVHFSVPARHWWDDIIHT